MVCLLTPTVAANWIAERPRFRRSVPRLFSISDICSMGPFCREKRPGAASCLACVTLIFLQDMSSHPALSALATLLAFSLPCFGQAGKAQLFGAIQDPSGLVVANAKVTSQEPSTGTRFEVLTDDRGEYHLLGLAAGQYVLTVEKPGFRPYRQAGITLRI